MNFAPVTELVLCWSHLLNWIDFTSASGSRTDTQSVLQKDLNVTAKVKVFFLSSHLFLMCRIET